MKPGVADNLVRVGPRTDLLLVRRKERVVPEHVVTSLHDLERAFTLADDYYRANNTGWHLVAVGHWRERGGGEAVLKVEENRNA